MLRALRRSGGMLVIYALLCGAMGFAMQNCRAASCQPKTRVKSWCSTPCLPAQPRCVPPR
ncbi:hypothetical protein ACVXG7_24675 [Enterobacter hormaechei]